MKSAYRHLMSSRNEFLRKKAKGLIRRAQSYLYWEKYSPVFARAALLIALFLIGSFAGLWQWIGDPWRLMLLFAALFYLVVSARRASKLKRPNRSSAMRRIEEDSEVDHRPLDTLFDKPAISEQGWAEHYRLAENEVDNLGKPRLRPALASVDKYFLRFITPVVLVLSLMVGVGDSFERLRHALTPGWLHGAMGDDLTFEAWIDPPEYTGRPPLYFKNKDSLEVPEGSELVARIMGTKSPSRLRLSSSGGNRHLALTRIGPESFEVRTIVKDPSQASWRIGQTRKVWEIQTIPDTAPEINFVREPDADKRDRLVFAYALKDDYGVENLTLKITLLQDDETAPVLSRDIDIPISGLLRSTDEKTAAIDLTKHEWAGKKVSAILVATDGLGQTGETEITYFTVPDKIFVEPLAKAIIEQRGLILQGSQEYAAEPRLTSSEWRNRPWFDTREPEFRLERAPASVQRASLLLDAVTDRPEGLFQDPAVFMGLRNASHRLHYARSLTELDGLPDDLWQIALRAEFGVLGTALEEMREAQAALRDGIARRAPQREIDALFDRYNEAVDRYREELLRQAIEDQNVADGQTPPGGGGGMNLDKIQELLDAIEEANRQGDSEGARRALAQLAELLENMEIQLSQGGGGGGGMPMEGEMTEEMREALEDLADILGEQRELRDQTREAERAQENQNGEDEGSSNEQAGSEQEGGEGGESGGSNTRSPMTAEELADMQGRLSELLENSERFLPEPGEDGSAGGEDEDGEEAGARIDPEAALEAARRAMEQAEDALERGEFGLAEDEQAEAIRGLREVGRALAEQARNEQGRDGNSDEASNDNSGDPLGREDGDGGNLDDSEADLDGRDPAARSRELQNEIRRRAAEQEREKDEREYLERLLKRF